MEQTSVCTSPLLLAANERLLQLRSLAQAQRQLLSAPPTQEGERSAPAYATAATKDRPDRNEAACLTNRLHGPDNSPPLPASPGAGLTDLVNSLPNHLGWGSQSLTHLLRHAHKQPAKPATYQPTTSSSQAVPTDRDHSGDDCNSSNPLSTHVKLYPDIGLAMLREEQTAAGRLWLLLRGLDKDGCGWVERGTVRHILASRKSSSYLCGWRQLRNLLKEGDGLYWQRDKERIWLRSAARVALELGVERLTGRPVLIETATMLQGIGRFRAELYAAFHSGRVKNAPNGQEAEAAPIARETLAAISGVGESTQRRYEAETGVDTQANYAIGNRVSQEELKRRAWQQGHAVFVLEDTRGQQGPKGRQYIAWQLPNSYSGSHQQCPKGRQRRINRQLTQMRENDLVMKGMPGNVEQTNETTRAKLYYPTGKLAAQAFNRGRVDSCYWQPSKPKNGVPTMNNNAIWHHLEAAPC